jgi:hypothetical protein
MKFGGVLLSSSLPPLKSLFSTGRDIQATGMEQLDLVFMLRAISLLADSPSLLTSSWLLLTPYSTANPSRQAEILATHESGEVWSQSS